MPFAALENAFFSLSNIGSQPNSAGLLGSPYHLVDMCLHLLHTHRYFLPLRLKLPARHFVFLYPRFNVIEAALPVFFKSTAAVQGPENLLYRWHCRLNVYANSHSLQRLDFSLG